MSYDITKEVVRQGLYILRERAKAHSVVGDACGIVQRDSVACLSGLMRETQRLVPGELRHAGDECENPPLRSWRRRSFRPRRSPQCATLPGSWPASLALSSRTLRRQRSMYRHRSGGLKTNTASAISSGEASILPG